jgi:hypothetical protein
MNGVGFGNVKEHADILEGWLPDPEDVIGGKAVLSFPEGFE